MSEMLPKELIKDLTWQERQTWECGFTPKCCSCKWNRPLDDYEKPNQLGDSYCVNVGRKIRVDWNDTCFHHEWIYSDRFGEDGEQIGLE